MARKKKQLDEQQLAILRIADEVYPDSLVRQSLAQGDKCGDTLALFISRELPDVYDPGATDQDNLNLAWQAMNMAVRELTAVRTAIEKVGGRDPHEE